jgi:electron transfer flavoprotein alpha/beta subunit
MNILVCFTAIPDLEMMIDEDWVVDENLQIDVSFLQQSLNCFDESALEIALKLSDAARKLHVPLNLGALTIAGPEVTAILKTLMALRFDRVVRIDNCEDLRFDSMAIASMLSRYVFKHAPQDVLLMGRQSGIGENAKTPLLTAEILGWPCITQVTAVELLDQTHLTVTSQVDDGRLQQTIQTPCVMSVGNAPNSYMRIPTLKDRIQFGKRSVEVLHASDFEPFDEGIELVSLEVINNERPGILIEGATPEEKARKLYKSFLAERLTKL